MPAPKVQSISMGSFVKSQDQWQGYGGLGALNVFQIESMTYAGYNGPALLKR